MTGFPPSSISTATTSPGFCRDCFTPLDSEASTSRCTSCRSPRLVRHAEWADLSIAHIDCDAFYAAIEKRDNPDIRDKPVIIGGGTRGVVSTACYIARISGVHSAMPMFQARKLCPKAVVIPPNMAHYAAVGQEIRQMMRDLTPLVEPLSIDEAFLDLTGTQRLHGQAAAVTLAKLAVQIEKQIGITVSVGLSHNKFLAKLASDFDKPRGFSIIGKAETVDFLSKLPVSKIWGVGKAMQERLARDGIRTISQIQNLSEVEMVKRYDQTGFRLARLARGLDERRVTPISETKSISTETTFTTDISDVTELERVLWSLSEKLARRCKEKKLAGRTVVLKAKTRKFTSLTRSHTRHSPTQMAEAIFRDGKALLQDLITSRPGEAYRLIGIGLSQITSDDIADIPDLAEPERKKQIDGERAMDRLRAKFGEQTIRKGRDLL